MNEFQWKKSSFRPRCKYCSKRLLYGKGTIHHCRACGEIVCDTCSQHTLPKNTVSGRHPKGNNNLISNVRVCNQCFRVRAVNVPGATIKVTFTEAGSLGLKLTPNKATGAVEVLGVNPGTQATTHAALVPGIKLMAVGATDVVGMPYKQVIETIKAQGRPVMCQFGPPTVNSDNFFATYELTLDNICEILNIDDIRAIWTNLSRCKPYYTDHHLMKENGGLNNSSFASKKTWLRTDSDQLKYYVLFCNRILISIYLTEIFKQLGIFDEILSQNVKKPKYLISTSSNDFTTTTTGNLSSQLWCELPHRAFLKKFRGRDYFDMFWVDNFFNRHFSDTLYKLRNSKQVVNIFIFKINGEITENIQGNSRIGAIILNNKESTNKIYARTNFSASGIEHLYNNNGVQIPNAYILTKKSIPKYNIQCIGCLRISCTSNAKHNVTILSSITPELFNTQYRRNLMGKIRPNSLSSKSQNNNLSGGNKEYINLQSGGKRLIRYGKRGGRYYIKGGNKININK